MTPHVRQWHISVSLWATPNTTHPQRVQNNRVLTVGDCFSHSACTLSKYKPYFCYTFLSMMHAHCATVCHGVTPPVLHSCCCCCCCCCVTCRLTWHVCYVCIFSYLYNCCLCMTLYFCLISPTNSCPA